MTMTPCGEETREIEAVVFACIPEYHQVQIRAEDGRAHAITRLTAGIDWAALSVGQRVSCTVTARLTRVLSAKLVEPGELGEAGAGETNAKRTTDVRASATRATKIANGETPC